MSQDPIEAMQEWSNFLETRALQAAKESGRDPLLYVDVVEEILEKISDENLSFEVEEIDFKEIISTCYTSNTTTTYYRTVDNDSLLDCICANTEGLKGERD